MTEYVFFLNVWMMSRLLLWSVVNQPQSYQYRIILAIQVLFPLVVFQFHWWLLLLMGLIAASTQITEKRFPKEGELAGRQSITFLIIALIGSLIFHQGIEFNEGFKRCILYIQGVSVLTDAVTQNQLIKINAYLFGLLVLTNEVNLLIRYGFYKLNLEPQLTTEDIQQPDKEQNSSQDSDTNKTNLETDQEEYNAGRVIGVLERYLMYVIVLFSTSSNAIAFIIAAKAFARFKQLDERHFAEYMLVGTLASTMAALSVAALVKSITA